MAYRIRWTPLALAGVLVLAGCEDALRPGQPSAHRVHHRRPAHKRIGPRGGVITSRDGDLTLTIPPGALSRNVRITIAPVAPEDLGPEWEGIPAEAAYELGPDGTTFGVPVVVTLRSHQVPVQTDSGRSFTSELLMTSAGGSLAVLDSPQVELTGDAVVVRGQLDHFSRVVRTPWNDIVFEMQGDVPTELNVGESFHQQAVVEVREASERRLANALLFIFFGEVVEPGADLYDGMYSVALSGPLRDLPAGPIREFIPRPAPAYIGKDFSCGSPGEAELVNILTVVLRNFKGREGPERSIEARFPPATVSCRAPLRLTIETVGLGFVTDVPVNQIDCGLDCEGLYSSGDSVTLLATPADGWRFVQWLKDCFGTSQLTGLRLSADATCQAEFDQVPTAAGLVFEGRYDLSFVADAAALSLAGNSVFIAAHEGGTDAIEVSLSDPANLTLVGEGALCDGTTAIIHANDPAIGPVVYGYSATSPWSCITQAPLGGLVQLFNLATAIGDAQPLPGDADTWLLTLHSLSLARRQTAAGAFTDLVLTPGERSCPGPIAFNSSNAYVVMKEGEPGTSSEPCNANRGVARIRRSDHTLTGLVSFGTAPRAPAVSADGSTLYVPDFAEHVVHVVNTSTLAVTRAIPLPGGPVAAALSPDGTHLVVARWFLDDLALVNLGTDQIVSTEPSRGRHPVRIIARPNGGFVILNYGEFPIVGGVLATFRYSQ